MCSGCALPESPAGRGWLTPLATRPPWIVVEPVPATILSFAPLLFVYTFSVNAEIIAIGSELLTPHRQDTNSLYLTGKLNELGIEVRFKSIVGDDRENLVAATKLAMRRSDIIIFSGGLGPTEDDLTREAVAEALGLALHRDPEIIARLEERFAKRGYKFSPNNARQAERHRRRCRPHQFHGHRSRPVDQREVRCEGAHPDPAARRPLRTQGADGSRMHSTAAHQGSGATHRHAHAEDGNDPGIAGRFACRPDLQNVFGR